MLFLLDDKTFGDNYRVTIKASKQLETDSSQVTATIAFSQLYFVAENRPENTE